MNHLKINNRRWYVSGIIHTTIGVLVWWKVWIKIDVAYESTDVWIRWMYKAVNNTKWIWCHMEDLAIHTGSPTVHWSDNKSCIYVVEAKRVTPIILKNRYSCLFYTRKMDNYSFVNQLW